MIEIGFLIAVIAALLFLSFQEKSGFTPPKTAPSDARTYAAYERAESLFVNKSELAFFHSLQRVLPSGFYLQSKTRLEDIVCVKGSIQGKPRWHLRGRVKSRHVDYLIIDTQGIPKLVIELDGSSHNQQAQNADTLKDGIFGAVGLPLIRVKIGEDFAKSAQDIMSRLTSL